MPAILPAAAVNQHYLSKVMGLADLMEVAASEDIVDLRGNKLVAKGTRMTRSQQTTLTQHKLRQSLESSLITAGATDAATIINHATRLLEMRMMLTLTERDGPHALDHSITVSLLSIAMARQLSAGARRTGAEDRAWRVCADAAVCHLGRVARPGQRAGGGPDRARPATASAACRAVSPAFWNRDRR